MTFSRKYAKKRKAVAAQQVLKKKLALSHGGGQARRLAATVTSLKVTFNGGQWLMRLIFAVVIIALMVGGWRFRHEFTLPIRYINVEGVVNQVAPSALNAVLNTVVEHSMFANLQPLQQRLLTLPWIKTVVVKRAWPNTLVVHLTEMQPVARFNQGLVLTRDGLIFSPPSLTHVMALPLLLGPPDKALFLWQSYCVMSDLLNPVGLKIWRLSLSPRFSYEVMLNNGLVLMLGATNVTERLQLFLKIYAQQLAPKIDQIAYIDLRYPSSLAIGWKDTSR